MCHGKISINKIFLIINLLKLLCYILLFRFRFKHNVQISVNICKYLQYISLQISRYFVFRLSQLCLDVFILCLGQYRFKNIEVTYESWRHVIE